MIMQNGASSRLYAREKGRFNLAALSGPGKIKSLSLAPVLDVARRTEYAWRLSPSHCLATELLSTPATMLPDSNCLNVDSTPLFVHQSRLLPRRCVSFPRFHENADPAIVMLILKSIRNERGCDRATFCSIFTSWWSLVRAELYVHRRS